MSSRRAKAPPAVLAVDSGNTKIDAVLLAADGSVLGSARSRGCSFSPDDHDRSIEALRAAVAAAHARAGRGAGAKVGIFCMAGADLPSDDRRLARALKPLRLADDVIVRNDTFAVLRA